jgi:tetratricopeptide (TPR) repeat protein
MAAIDDALTAHRNGDMARADALYRQILKADARNFDALHMLGILCAQRSNFSEAEQHLRAAVAIDRSVPPCLHNYGKVLSTIGRHDAAIEVFNKALALAPNYVPVYSDRGNAQLAAGRLQEALQSYDRGIALEPRFAPAHYNRGIVLERLRRHAEALTSYERALALHPHYAEAENNRCGVLEKLGRYDDALKSCDRALELAPNLAQAHCNRAIVLDRLNRSAEALESCTRAVALDPNAAQVQAFHGSLLLKAGRHAQALQSCDRALALDPDIAQAHYDRGVALARLARYQEALSACDRALALDPDHAQAHTNRSYVLERLKRYPEALEACGRALALRPDLAQAQCNRGVVFTKLNRFPDALESFDQALALDANLAPVHCNRGVALRHMNRLGDAMASLQTALALEPESGDAHFNIGELKLLSGDFAGGLPEYEWRWQSGTTVPALRRFLQPLWRGTEPLGGKTILLHGEQGLGDTVQFCRYVPLVAERGARVVLEVPASLLELMRGLPGAAQIVTSGGGPLPAFDLHCPLATLPLAFATRVETIPADIPYLSASASYVDKWRHRLGSAKDLKVGLCWAGNPNLPNDHMRSIDLQFLTVLFSLSEAHFFSLQKDLRDGDAALLRACPQVVHLGDELASFADTAAVVSLLDVVISADTVVAHLAGAMGAKTWVLLPYVAEWRWLLGRSDSPWYPTARLFRQPALNDWAGAVAAVGAALDEVSRSRAEQADTAAGLR